MSMLDKVHDLFWQCKEGEDSLKNVCKRLVFAEHKLEVQEMYISGLEAELAETQKELRYALGKKARLMSEGIC